MIPKATRHAFLSVYHADGGKHVSLVDSSAFGTHEGMGHSPATHNFILQSVQYQVQEKAQIQQTFGPFYVFFYGQQPTVLQCSGLLLNGRDFNWKNEWLRNYDRYLRGTKCVESRSRVYLGFDDVLIGGYIMGTGNVYDASNPVVCPFSFSFLVTDYKDLSDGNTDEYVSHAMHARYQGSALGAPVTGKPEYLTPPALADYQFVDPATGQLRGPNIPEQPAEDASAAATQANTEIAVQASGRTRQSVRAEIVDPATQYSSLESDPDAFGECSTSFEDGGVANVARPLSPYSEVYETRD
jgi:hypothetical protein